MKTKSLKLCTRRTMRLKNPVPLSRPMTMDLFYKKIYLGPIESKGVTCFLMI